MSVNELINMGWEIIIGRFVTILRFMFSFQAELNPIFAAQNDT